MQSKSGEGWPSGAAAPTPRSTSRLAIAIRAALASTCLLIPALPAAAQEADDALALLYGDEETVSIATGTKKPLRLAPSVASVITAQDIRALGARSLDEVLETVPGLHISLSRRYSSLVSIRGIHTNLNPQVLFLIDGFPITELFTGGRIPTFRLPVHAIDRVEIIRGPGSAIYGADAFAGVINVITKSASELSQLGGGLAAGSFDTRNVWVQGGGSWGGWDLGVSVEKLSSEGDPDRIIARDLQSSLDDSFGTSASRAPHEAAADFDVTNAVISLERKHWNLSLNSWKQDEAGIGTGISDALDHEGYQNAEQHLASVKYESEDKFENWQLSASVSYFYAEQDSYYTLFPAGAIVPIGEDGNIDFISPTTVAHFVDGVIATPSGHDQHTAVELAAYYTGLPNHRLRIATGYKHQQERVSETKNYGPGVLDGTEVEVDGRLVEVTDTPFIYIPNQRRTIRHLSVQDEWSLLKDWELTAGVRYDDYSDFGDTFNPRFALVWQTSYNVTSKLLYGRAFRAPSFSEQFAINNPVILGNADVEPEQIDTLELSFEYRPTYDLTTRINLFTYDVEGLIDYVDDDGQPGGTSTAQNVLDQDGYGFEVEAMWTVSDRLHLAANYSWQQSENVWTGDTIPDAPQKLAFVDVRWNPLDKWTLSAQWHRVADRARSVGDMRSPVDDYDMVHMNLFSEGLTRHFDMGLSVRNLFDTEAWEPSLGPSPSIPGDHPLEGRRIMFELTFRR